MKKLLLFAILAILASGSYSQDSVGFKTIDSLVNIIDHSNLHFQTDSMYKVDTFLHDMTMRKRFKLSHYFDDDNNLKKLVMENEVWTKQQENDLHVRSVSTFYYWVNKVIKIDDSGGDGNIQKSMTIYCLDDKPPSCSDTSEKAEIRCHVLFDMSKTLLSQFQQSKNKAEHATK